MMEHDGTAAEKLCSGWAGASGSEKSIPSILMVGSRSGACRSSRAMYSPRSLAPCWLDGNAENKQIVIGPLLVALEKRQANYRNDLSLSVTSQIEKALLLNTDRKPNWILDRELT